MMEIEPDYELKNGESFYREQAVEHLLAGLIRALKAELKDALEQESK